GLDAAQEDVLACGHDVAVDEARRAQLAQRSAQAHRLRVAHATGRNRQAVDPRRAGLLPTVVLAGHPLGQARVRLNAHAAALQDLLAQPVLAVIVDRVLEPGLLPIVAAAEVALRGDDRLDDVTELLRGAPSDLGG